MGVFGMAGSDCGRWLLFLDGTRCTRPDMVTTESRFVLDERCEFARSDIEEDERRAAARMSGWGTTCEVMEARERCAVDIQAWAGLGSEGHAGEGVDGHI
jgi:hypothetical protein